MLGKSFVIISNSINLLGLLVMIHKFPTLVSVAFLLFDFAIPNLELEVATQDFIIPNFCWGLFEDLGFQIVSGGMYRSMQSEICGAPNVFGQSCPFLFSSDSFGISNV